LGFGGGQINLYAYVGNNPVNLIDPYGLYGTDFTGFPDFGPLQLPPVCFSGENTNTNNNPVPPPDSCKDGTGDPDWAKNLTPVDPGRDSNGNCNLCPADSVVWEHTHCDGTKNSHQIVWNQNPSTCMCYPKRTHV
jgi:hypothetical protein